MCLTGGLATKAYTVCMIALLPDKTRDSYERLFSLVHDYFESEGFDLDWSGMYFMTDFELAVRESIRLFFPNVILFGCFFLFSQVTEIILQFFGFF